MTLHCDSKFCWHWFENVHDSVLNIIIGTKKNECLNRLEKVVVQIFLSFLTKYLFLFPLNLSESCYVDMRQRSITKMDQMINNYLKHTCSIHCAYKLSHKFMLLVNFFLSLNSISFCFGVCMELCTNILNLKHNLSLFALDCYEKT